MELKKVLTWQFWLGAILAYAVTAIVAYQLGVEYKEEAYDFGLADGYCFNKTGNYDLSVLKFNLHHKSLVVDCEKPFFINPKGTCMEFYAYRTGGKKLQET